MAVAATGGVLLRQPIIREAFIALLDGAGGVAIVEPRHSPAYGAALYAHKRRMTR